MADASKQFQISSNTFFSELKKSIFFMRRRRTVAFAYGFVFMFVACSAFMAFNPSYNNSTWFSGFFSYAENAHDNSTSSTDTAGSQFASLYSYFFPISTESQLPDRTLERMPEKGVVINEAVSPAPAPAVSKQVGNLTVKPETLIFPNSTRKVDLVKKKKENSGESTKLEKSGLSNFTASLRKKGTENRTKSSIQDLLKCDLFDGNWVKDESYPLYEPGSCTLIDEQFNCVANGRPDKDYMKMKWKPRGCNLPRLDAKRMLELLRGRRLVYVGDSLNRNMWESMICILKSAVKNPSNVYEASGSQHFRSEASYSFIFKDYNFSVEFFVSPFLVQEWESSSKNGVKKETLRLDLIGQTADGYKGADILIFNTGHWWTHDKTSKGEDYYQEGTHVYHELNVLEAFRKALTTWGRWVDRNVDPSKTHVFFRGYSASHFGGGQWNSGGACDSETEPIKNETYLTPYPSKMTVLEKVFRGMKTPVSYLNITRITDFRKDGHPSIYRRLHISEEEKKAPLKYQDCSHWCLPGVPDTWNEILYAQLLVKDYERQHKQST